MKNAGIGFLILAAGGFLVAGMYIGVSLATQQWIPQGWLLAVIVAFSTLAVGYLLGRVDGDSKH